MLEKDNNELTMEFIWEKIPKNKEGLIHYLETDIPYLYYSGFVDHTLFTYEEWEAEFQDCKQNDGSYLLTKEKFISLYPFRYAGPVQKPFDPYKVREGEWSQEQLAKLYEYSIKPSATFPEDVFWNSVETLKKKGFSSPSGNLIVNDKVKKQLAYLIERFPSPRRNLETEINRIKKGRESTYREVGSNRNKSNFVEGKFESEDKLEAYKKLQSKAVDSKKSDSIEDNQSSESLDIKSLKRPRGPIKG